MIKTISRELYTTLARFWKDTFPGKKSETFTVNIDETNVDLFTLNTEKDLHIYAGVDTAQDLELLASYINSSDFLSRNNVYEIFVVVESRFLSIQETIISRGVKIVPVHVAIATVIGLPAGWRDSQLGFLEQTLANLRQDGGYELARLYATFDTEREREVAQDFLDNIFQSWSGTPAPLTYIRAEAGKGKSTLLAHATLLSLQNGSGPLPIYIPLRTLQRNSGISWEEIVSRIGVFGPVTANLRKAVSSGLITLVLDGLDEVAGRYDPSVIENLVSLISKEVSSQSSKVLISGRTTESFLLDREISFEVGIDLPDTDDEEFKKYVCSTISSTTPEWPKWSRRVPESRFSSAILDDVLPTDRQKDQIFEWLRAVFDAVGKERSLFFVQSLACIARSLQLNGNKPLVINNSDDVYVAPVDLYDVSILAGTLACIREQDKIEDIAAPVFTPEKQLDILTCFALKGSAEDHLASQLPTPNELVDAVFDIDTVNQSEEFTATVRQMQKHALLFSGAGGSARFGEWRPTFISDWIKSAFLCRAWINRSSMTIPESDVKKITARALRSRIAYQHFFPEIFRTDDPKLGLEELVITLCHEADRESPEATSNYWTLISGLAPEKRSIITMYPKKVCELTDLTETFFEDFNFKQQFSTNLAFFVSAEFENCTFENCIFDSCDFTDAIFNDCNFLDVQFVNCNGLISFNSCELNNTNFENTLSKKLPGLYFFDCQFTGSIIKQDLQPTGTGVFQPVVKFKECSGDSPLSEFCLGEWLGFDPLRTEGYSTEAEAIQRPHAEQCLRVLLKTFFPRRAGMSGQVQARRYIRSSALGRGVLPEGSPNIGQLTSFLQAEGFTDGGREGHLYAPWSSVVGATDDSIALRKELISFFVNDSKGPTINRLLDKINRSAQWNL